MYKGNRRRMYRPGEQEYRGTGGEGTGQGEQKKVQGNRKIRYGGTGEEGTGEQEEKVCRKSWEA